MFKPPLEGCVQAYWRMARDLRLIRSAGGDDRAEIEEIADLADFVEHEGLRKACISQLHCEVAVTTSTEEVAR